MEKRFLLFIVLTMLLLTGHVLMRTWLAPPPPPVAQQDELEGPGGEEPEIEPAADEPPADDASQDQTSPGADEVQPDAERADAGREAPDRAVVFPQRWVTLGTYTPPDGASLLVTFNSRGATVERIELTQREADGDLKYLNLDDKSGYLGHLSLTEAADGCRVNVVPPGTPAASARASDGSVPAGLQVGDVITQVSSNGAPLAVHTPEDLRSFVKATKPKDTLVLRVRRDVNNDTVTRDFTVTLDVRPFQMVRPEPLEPEEFMPHPLSYLLSLTQIGSLKAEEGQAEIAGLASLRNSNWEVKQLEGPEPAVEFRFQLQDVPGMSGPLELVKRFRLGTSIGEPVESDLPVYHLTFEMEIINHGDEAQQVAYRLDGPTGLPLEGWWYSNKIHPRMFKSAGARDVLISTGGAPGYNLIGCSEIFKTATKRPNTPTTALFTEEEPPESRTLQYVGVDTQYFVAALVPHEESRPEHFVFRHAEAMALGDVEQKKKGKIRTTNVSFHLGSQPLEIGGGESFAQQFVLYSGPKQPEVLRAYGLEDVVYYGWFGWVAKPLAQLLHFFYMIVSNYGLAIILLTVLVRSCMFPLSRKAAMNAAMMQELAPEMKKITEKYKGDMEKRAKAQQELFRKNNYNPLGGCWLMFLQLPIFLGLYRCLSVDIELRQASLIPGLNWCSNLAGPDMLWHWENGFLGLFTETGLLGPYLNVLPIFTIALFLVHQKLFMPPPTDEQTRMQMQMMKFMMVFMGVMFFKVASGLCLYFIASSLWGIAERKLLPKPPKKPEVTEGGTGGGGAKPRSKPPAGGGSNGSGKRSARAKKRNKRR